MKKNFLKSALALQAHKAALESIDGTTQVAADEAQAAQAVAGANLPVGEGAAPESTQETALSEADIVAAAVPAEKDTGLSVANEGIGGLALGMIIGSTGYIPGWGLALGANTANAINATRKEIQKVVAQIEKQAQIDGKSALDDGSITKKEYEEFISGANKSSIVLGALGGQFLGPFYGAVKGDELEELHRRLGELTKKLKKEIDTANVKPANESGDEADAATAAAATEAPAAEAPADAAPVEAEAPAEEAPSEDAPTEGEAAPADETAPAAAEAEAPAEAPAEGEAAPTEEAPADTPVDETIPAEGESEPVAGEEADPSVGDVSDAAAAGADEVVGDVGEEADAAISDEIEDQLGEVEQAGGEIADVESDVETMNDALESLDNCSAILRASIQRGGLDQFGGALLRNNLNTVTRTLKIRPLPLPALEDMEDPSAKIDAADTANAQVTGLMQNISNTVREGLSRFGKWIADTTAQLTDVYARLEKRADLLGQRAQAAEGDKGGEVTVSGLSAGGQPVQNLVKYLQDLEKTVLALGNAQTYDGYIQLLDTAEELVKTPAESEALAAKATQQLLAFRKKLAQVVKSNGDQLSVGFLGNRSVVITVPADLHELAQFSAKVQKDGEAQDSNVPALKQKEVISLCAKVKEMAAAYRSSMAEASGMVKQLNKRISDKMGVIVDLSSRLDAKDGESGGNLRKVANWVSRIVMTSAKLPVHAVYAEVPRTLSIALDCASKSIGAPRPAVAPEVAAAQ